MNYYDNSVVLNLRYKNKILLIFLQLKGDGYAYKIKTNS